MNYLISACRRSTSRTTLCTCPSRLLTMLVSGYRLCSLSSIEPYSLHAPRIYTAWRARTYPVGSEKLPATDNDTPSTSTPFNNSVSEPSIAMLPLTARASIHKANAYLLKRASPPQQAFNPLGQRGQSLTYDVAESNFTASRYVAKYPTPLM